MPIWLQTTLDLLAKTPVCDFDANGPGASEPTALAAIALLDHERKDPARQSGEFLLSLQAKAGHIGMRQSDSEPHWPTSLALLVWKRLDESVYSAAIDKALKWSLSITGMRFPLDPSTNDHNTMLAAWPWVEGTYSWMEPSAFFAIALKAHGLYENIRLKEALTLLVDRLLPGGGCNYGNTYVLGQLLVPHVQPSGIVALALAGEKDESGRLDRTLDFLMKACNPETTPNSLCWAILGLAAHDRLPSNKESLLNEAFVRTMKRGGSPYTLALLANAAMGEKSFLIQKLAVSKGIPQ